MASAAEAVLSEYQKAALIHTIGGTTADERKKEKC